MIVGGDVIGVLTLDALEPTAFDRVQDDTVAMLAALAGAAIHTAVLIDALEDVTTRNKLVTRQLITESLERAGGEILGTSAVMVALRNEIELLGRSDLTALITGETGVAKSSSYTRSTLARVAATNH